jgi:hypothetical protein
VVARAWCSGAGSGVRGAHGSGVRDAHGSCVCGAHGPGVLGKQIQKFFEQPLSTQSKFSIDDLRRGRLTRLPDADADADAALATETQTPSPNP